MPGIIPIDGFCGGVGGGAGFELGPDKNVFTGSDRAAAELERDTYTTANPSWLAEYEVATGVKPNIRLEFLDGTEQAVAYQVRNSAGTAWADNESVVAIKGDSGASAWGDISGDINNQSDLQSELNDRLSKSSGGTVDSNLTVNANFDAGSGGFTVKGKSSGFNNTNPQDWSSEIDAVSLGGKSYLAVDNTRGTIFQSVNLFFDGTNWIYKEDGAGSNIRFKDDGFVIRTAVAGVAGDVATLTDLAELSLTGLTYKGVNVATSGSLVSEEVFLSSGSNLNQEPTSTDSPIIVSFGSNSISNGLIDYDGSGSFTCQSAGDYKFNISYQYGRTASAGISWLYGGVLVNGVAQLISRLGKVSNSSDDVPIYIPVNVSLQVGDIVQFDLWRGSEGNNDGGLIATTPALATKPPVPSAFVSVSRLIIS